MWAYRQERPRPFADRAEGGRRLAEQLAYLKGEHPVVLGLARGGVEVAAEIAKALGADLNVLVARKLGAPMQPELGVGAIAPEGVVALNEDIIRRLGLTAIDIEAIAQRELQEIDRRLQSYTTGRPAPALRDRVVIVVDDGLATGYTALAAVRYVRSKAPRKVILAVPVCAVQAMEMLAAETDEVVCAEAPDDLVAVGYWYEDFKQTTDDEVLELLRASSVPQTHSPSIRSVQIPIDGEVLFGDLTVPANAKGLVIFAHGSGSGRHSPRNKFVASELNGAGMATLLMDLLTPDEERRDAVTAHLRFDIDLLADRLHLATAWGALDQQLAHLPIGYFGASTGAAAALIAAAEATHPIRAVVSRGGRPDLADRSLAEVKAPTLLIVGSLDWQVLELNRQAYNSLATDQKKVEIVEGASHLFQEPGTLEAVAGLAARWFERYLG